MNANDGDLGTKRRLLTLYQFGNRLHFDARVLYLIRHPASCSRKPVDVPREISRPFDEHRDNV